MSEKKVSCYLTESIKVRYSVGIIVVVWDSEGAETEV